MKRSSMSLIIRGIQIKTKARYHLACVGVAISKETKNNKGCGERGGKGTLVHH